MVDVCTPWKLCINYNHIIVAFCAFLLIFCLFSSSALLLCCLVTGSSFCTDKISNCADYSQSVCTNPGYTQWVSENCPKFCNKCPSGSSSGTVYQPGTMAPVISGTNSNFNPFPNKPWCLLVCIVSILKRLLEKEKLCFLPFWRTFCYFIKFEIVVCRLLQFGRVWNVVVW